MANKINNNLSTRWENLSEEAPSRVTKGIGNVISNSGKYFAPTVKMIGGSYVAESQGRNAIDVATGNDSAWFKASTSNVDKAVGVGVHGLLAVGGAALAVHGAIQFGERLAADLKKD